MILGMSSLLNEIVERRLLFILKESIESLLVFATSMHCLAKKILLFKISNIIVIVINWWNARYFLLFKIVFNIDQYTFGLVVVSINSVEISV